MILPPLLLFFFLAVFLFPPIIFFFYSPFSGTLVSVSYIFFDWGLSSERISNSLIEGNLTTNIRTS